jgi:FKBP-type peptidyl-prolyl cis-trans isomerase
MARGRGRVEFEDLVEGVGPPASRGAEVQIRYTLQLNRGETLAADTLCTFRVGKRQVVAGLDYGVEGMKVGGTRLIRVGPHLAYRSNGVPGRIPPDALLVFTVLLLSVQRPPSNPSSPAA